MFARACAAAAAAALAAAGQGIVGCLVRRLVVVDVLVSRGLGGPRSGRCSERVSDMRRSASFSGAFAFTREERQQGAQGPFDCATWAPNWPLRRALTGALTGRCKSVP